MVEERELALLLVSLGSVAAGFALRRDLPPVPGATWLHVAGGAWLVAASLTVLEGLLPVGGDLANLGEHAAWAVSTLAVVGWALRHGLAGEAS